jgi:hypothetical protein
MHETIQEYVDSRGVELRVDAKVGVIRGVKILGLESRNRRTYAAEALAHARELYEGAKVNINHPHGDALAPRDYRDRIGVIRGVTFRDGHGLFGNLYFNPKHALAEQLVWDAQHAAENVGFSHNVQARVARKDGGALVQEILQVRSVDLVADPATTRGLFEQQELDGQDSAASAEIVRSLEQKISLIETELAEYKAREAREQRRRQIRELLVEYELPDPERGDPAAQAVVSEYFIDELLAAADEAELRSLVRERAKLVRSLGIESSRPRRGKPVSRDQTLVDRRYDAAVIVDAKSFAAAIT